MQNGAVWIIDSDLDDQFMVREVWNDLTLTNDLVFLQTAHEALAMLQQVDQAPFIILCRLGLPGMDGFELREKLLHHPSKKFRSVPFIFWSSHASEEQITHAYELAVHGFFIKDNTFEELKATFATIIKYWLKSKMPAKTAA